MIYFIAVPVRRLDVWGWETRWKMEWQRTTVAATCNKIYWYCPTRPTHFLYISVWIGFGFFLLIVAIIFGVIRLILAVIIGIVGTIILAVIIGIIRTPRIIMTTVLTVL